MGPWEQDGVYPVSLDRGGQGLALRWPVPAGGPGAGESVVEDCDASIATRLHPSSFTVQGCGEPQRQDREGFPAKPGEWNRLQGVAVSAGKELARAHGDSEPGWSVGKGSHGPPSDPAVGTSPRRPHHPGAWPYCSPTGSISPQLGAGGASLPPPEPPMQTVRGKGHCCSRHEFCPWGFALKPELEPQLARCWWQGRNPNASCLHHHPRGAKGVLPVPRLCPVPQGQGVGGGGRLSSL